MGAYQSHETYNSINTDVKDGKRYWARFVDKPFAKGASRLAFQGTLYGDGPRNGSKCVTKVFKSEYAQHFVQMAPDLAASKKALGYAEEFGRNYFRRIRNYIHENEIEFLIPLIAKMQYVSTFNVLWFIPYDTDSRYVKSNEHVSIEPFIEGQYDKFNSNGGYEKSIHELMTTFCHWTWYISGHKFMVCDLQGVKSGRKYILTDPAIHSYDCRFGNTDLGVVGMEMVLGNHNCNKLCRELGLNNPMTGLNMRSGPRSTTYSFQVTEEDLLRANRGSSRHFRPMSAIFEVNNL
ncbi:alpha-protein kinase vwkA-like [Mya arenaria]|uniref:alpha-protein kinase vwkA-like n=1 Tax=Mya arenaria TaxID=6604 RepID=UPI0022E3C3AD|nr:alpha-protein kinase vwkA-like [Mya arenaria]